MSFYNKYKYLRNMTFKKLTMLYLIILECIPIKYFSIRNYYGRLGNNLQQIANGIIFSEIYRVKFISKKHPLINIVASSTTKPVFIKKYRFFNYSENYFLNLDTPRNKPLVYKDVVSRIHRIFQEKLLPNIHLYKKINIPKDTLVIHIRSGDIFEKTKHFDQVQNPLNFYLEVIKNYENLLIVTSPSRNNPVLNELKNLKTHNVTIQSSSVEDDFNALLNATNLCLSGVGTFGIAAALLSPNLKRLYFTNLYMKSHLNPEMVDFKKVEKIEYKINNYLQIGEWTNSKKDVELMLSAEVEVKCVEK